MIEKAVRLLTTETDDQKFDLRMITGLSFSADPKLLPEARERLMAALFEIADFLGSGDCTEVYQLNAQLFPLTRVGRKGK